jgi:futalosine hydrolase
MILLVAATYMELAPFLSSEIGARVGLPSPIFIEGAPAINGLISGIGSGLTASNLSRTLALNKYDMVIGLGIAGSYGTKFSLGDVVMVIEDCFADYGIDNKGSFETLFQSGLMHHTEFPFINGKLLSQEINNSALNNIKRAKGITVSAASGSEQTIKKWQTLLDPDVETMENAAVFYSCLMANVPFICIRSISNRVEPRSKLGWNIPLALENLKTATLQLVKSLND